MSTSYSRANSRIPRGREKIISLVDLQRCPNESLISYKNTAGVFKIGGSLLKTTKDYFIYLAPDGVTKKRVRLCYVEEMYVARSNNLHMAKINVEISGYREQQNYNIVTPQIECYFKNLEKTLCDKISQADAVVGCVAWLTNINILKKLKEVKNGVLIVVQKEDFLRPDTVLSNSKSYFKYYSQLTPLTTNSVDCYFEGTYLDEIYNTGCDWTQYAVKCVGNHNSDKNPIFPRMHNKFLIFGRVELDENEKDNFKPYAVWTGSLNLTSTAMKSFENGIYIKDKTIVQAYLKEWGQIFSLSEDLNWQSEYCASELRIGS